MNRDWDKFYLSYAIEVAKMSSCVRRKVGAVLVKDNRIIATGYNGTLSDAQECCDHFTQDFCSEEHKAWSRQHEIHAEQNLILDLCRRRAYKDDTVLYITCLPCSTCALSLIELGISKVIYTGEQSSDTHALELFDTNFIDVKEVNASWY